MEVAIRYRQNMLWLIELYLDDMFSFDSNDGLLIIQFKTEKAAGSFVRTAARWQWLVS